MAGEKKGITYEAFVKIALDELREKGIIAGDIYWNETPIGLSGVPDFIIGKSLNNPQIIILVTHFGSISDSHKKCWRNIGELCEAKSFLPERPAIVSIVFDTQMKAALKEIQDEAFDAQLLVGDKEYGRYIIDWVKANINDLPSEKSEKAAAIKSIADKNKELKAKLTMLKEGIEECLKIQRPELNHLWDLERSRKKKTAPTAKNTYMRRGFIKRILAGQALKGEKVEKNSGPWLQDIGLAIRGISGYKIIDSELLWFLETKWANHYQEVVEGQLTEGFINQLQKVRSLRLLYLYRDYLVSNLKTLKTPSGMMACIQAQHRDPSSRILIPTEVEPPNNIWIYDYISALEKANHNKSQAFGYSSFTNHPLGQDIYVGNMRLGQWCECFICEYFNRKPNFSLPNGALEFIAAVLAEVLSKYSSEQIVQLSEQTKEKFIAKEYEATLLAHNGVDPLLAILIHSGIVDSKYDAIVMQSCFAEKAAAGGQSGSTTVIHVRNTLINWQSSYGGHPADKKKELCGRAVGLRYTWNESESKFVPRDGIKKLILLLDGTWQQNHLEALVHAGWDEIYYPDEIDKLKAAIV